MRSSNRSKNKSVSPEKVQPKPKAPVPYISSKRTLRESLTVNKFVKTIRKATDLAHRIDWALLSNEQHHSKVIDLTQLVINDLFGMVASAFEEDDAALIVSDFQKTFYPADGEKNMPRDVNNTDLKNSVEDGFDKEGGGMGKIEVDDGYKSFDTFGGEKGNFSTQEARYGTLTQSLGGSIDQESPSNKAAKIRSMT